MRSVRKARLSSLLDRSDVALTTSPARCLVSFGANIGDAAGTIRKAAGELASRVCVGPDESFRLSRLFKTPPVGGPTGQPPFVNAVAALETRSSPWHVWEAVRQVESLFGRERNLRWEARKLDLDILLYDQIRIWTPQLKVPHPRMCMRRFILAPANDVAPFWVDPVSQRSVKDLYRQLQRGGGSLTLVELAGDSATRILASAAQQAGAEWLPETQVGATDSESTSKAPSPKSGSLESGSLESDTQKPHSLARRVKLIRLADGLSSRTSQDPSRSDSAGDNLPDRVRWQSYWPDLITQIDRSETNLTVFLTPPKIHAGAAWEDVHRDLAAMLRLADNGLPATTQSAPGNLAAPDSSGNLAGARYLLPSEDPDWATHELVAALDAMDCPVESIDG